jgi:hypothetical protein
MRSGKDTVAQLLVDHYRREGQSATIYKFAQTLYTMLDDIDLQLQEARIASQHFVLREYAHRFLAVARDQGILLQYNSAWTAGLADLIEQTLTAPTRIRLVAIAAFLRGLSPEIFINFLHPQVLACEGMVVISDLRYMNEAIWAQSQGLYRLRIDVDPLVQRDRLGEAYDPKAIGHPSESFLDAYPFTKRITNNGDLRKLGEEIAVLVAELSAKNEPRRFAGRYVS